MRKIICIVALLMGAIHVSAQYETGADSVSLPLPSIHINTNLLGPDATKDYVQLFLLPLQMVPSKSHTIGSFHSPYGAGSFFLTPTTLQTATFKLNENMRLSTYGQYTLDGRRIPNPGALPWEKNNFMGGMELKFNKNFGIRIEVQQGHYPMYPY